MTANKGWFKTGDRDGDRTLEQQMVGLDRVLQEVKGKNVLDFGCAEGLIAIELAAAGAANVIGVEVVADHVALGRRLVAARGLPVELMQGNLNEPETIELPTEQADIVLMLAILHKLRDPSAFARLAAGLAKSLVVVRMPPRGMVIRDERSFWKPHDIGAVLAAAGFALEHEERGTFDEYIAYFRRAGAQAAPAPAAESAPAPSHSPAPAPAPQVVPDAATVAPTGADTAPPEPPLHVATEAPATTQISGDESTADKPVVERKEEASEESKPLSTDSGSAGAIAGETSVGTKPTARRGRARE